MKPSNILRQTTPRFFGFEISCLSLRSLAESVMSCPNRLSRVSSFFALITQ